jgi:GT2 family glycosyltransferase
MARSHSRLLAIVLCHDGVELTLGCLDSLLQQAPDTLDVLVIDSASRDGTAEAVRSRFPHIDVLRSSDNLGYARGNNLGIRYGLERGASRFLLLNNDILVEADSVEALLRSLESHPQTGILGPLVLTWDAGETIGSAGGSIDWVRGDAVNIGAGETHCGQYPGREVDFIHGCCLLITKQAIQRAGLFDERYFLYWEETDWCARVRRAGLDVRFEPSARIRHKAPIEPGELGPGTLYYMTRNRILFFSTHGRGIQGLRSVLHAYHGAWRRWRHEKRTGRDAHARALRQAMLDAFRKRWGRGEVIFGAGDDA